MRAIPHKAILAELTCDAVLDTAYDWLCGRRRAYPADADAWSFRQAWAQEAQPPAVAPMASTRNIHLMGQACAKLCPRIPYQTAADKLSYLLDKPNKMLQSETKISGICSHRANGATQGGFFHDTGDRG